MTTAFILPLWSAGIAMLLTSAALGQTSLIKASVPNQPADIRTLAIAETIPLSATPALVSLQSRTRCDEKGNIYTVQNTVSGMPLMSAGLSGLAVSKLLPSAKLIIPYPVPILDQYRGVIRIDFDVSADGKVYSLLEAVDASSKQDSGSFYSFVARHRDEGGLESFVKLSDPPDLHLQPSRFAVFRNGYFMVGGTVEIERDTLRPFVAVFDPFGRFIQYVQGFDPQDRKSTARNQAGLSNNAFMAGGPDGNVYLLNGAAHPHLYAVSPTGDVVRDFDITLPAKGLSVSNMTMAGNQRHICRFSPHRGNFKWTCRTRGAKRVADRDKYADRGTWPVLPSPTGCRRVSSSCLRYVIRHFLVRR